MSSALMDDSNWGLVDQAYGANADLYENVLRIAPTSSNTEITRAYFDRRNELFAILADLDASSTLDDDILESQKHRAECRMKAVVFAGRVLGDALLRKDYHNRFAHRLPKDVPNELPSLPPRKRKDEKPWSKVKSVRGRRSTRYQEASRTQSVRTTRSIQPLKTEEDRSPRQTRSFSNRGRRSINVIEDSDDDDEESLENQRRRRRNNRVDRSTPTTQRRGRSPPAPVVSPDKDDTTLGEATLTDGDTITLMTEDSAMPPKSLAGVLLKEVSGCCDDASNTLHDVFSVFTLRDDDIANVTQRIRLAKQSLKDIPRK